MSEWVNDTCIFQSLIFLFFIFLLTSLSQWKGQSKYYDRYKSTQFLIGFDRSDVMRIKDARVMFAWAAICNGGDHWPPVIPYLAVNNCLKCGACVTYNSLPRWCVVCALPLWNSFETSRCILIVWKQLTRTFYFSIHIIFYRF